MKRPIALLASLLAVTVLATAATAAGGDASDPLISLNYLQTTFTTKANSSIDAALDKADQAAYAKAEAALRSTIAAAEANVGAQRADVFTESRLKQGDILSGTTGLQVIVLAGSVNVQFSSGAVVDVTTGSEVKSGAALAENHRYLVAEDTTALFTVTGKTTVVNCCGFYSIASSSSVDYPAMAASLKTLTLFRGSDTGYGEGFDLEKAPTRMEALIMLIRLLGADLHGLPALYRRARLGAALRGLRLLQRLHQRRRPNDIRHDDECIGGDVHRISAARTALQLHRAV